MILSKLGAVSVTPQNMLALLRAGESVLLYPGGAKEALHQKVIILGQLRLSSAHIHKPGAFNIIMGPNIHARDVTMTT